MPSMHLTVADEAATLALGGALAPHLAPGMRVYLRGGLGAGKTTFVRGLLRALGHTGRVKSPTYTLVEIYVVSGYILYHFDFYRFVDPEEWLEAGLDENFNDRSVCLVEWPEKAGDLLPTPDLDIAFELGADALGEARDIVIEGLSRRGESCLDALRLNRPPTPPP